MDNNRRCLLIDDEDQNDEMERIVSIGKKKGLVITCEQFKVGAQSRQDLLSDGALDKIKIFTAFKKEFKGHYDIIAFDYDLQDVGVTGITLVGLLGATKRTAIKLVYSGMLDSILKDILLAYVKHKKFNDAKSKLKALFTTGVIDFVERQGMIGYEEVIINCLTGNSPALDKLFVKKLQELGEMKFKSTYPTFKEKTLNEIAEEIENSTPHSIGFQLELIEQTISNMIELNK